MFDIIKDLGSNIVPIFGMVFVSYMLFLNYREKQEKNKEKIALIEKGLDPSLLDSKPKNQQYKNQQNSFKSGFFSNWLEIEKRPNQKLFEAVGNYSDELCEHKGNDIVLSLLYRGFVFTPYLTNFYEEQITIGEELIKTIEEYVYKK
jgi:hypothetical protein